jgi:hypothetical protein
VTNEPFDKWWWKSRLSVFDINYWLMELGPVDHLYILFLWALVVMPASFGGIVLLGGAGWAGGSFGSQGGDLAALLFFMFGLCLPATALLYKFLTDFDWPPPRR